MLLPPSGNKEVFTSCLVKLLSSLAFNTGISNSYTSSIQSLVGVATFITYERYLHIER